LTSIPPPHTPYDWQEYGARRAEREERARASGTREISARSRRIVGAVLLLALVVMLFFGILTWIDYFATHAT
jgi:ferric-dicitrate binding protein FerR (iron transport regulator)